jgi:hypothetical protein
MVTLRHQTIVERAKDDNCDLTTLQTLLMSDAGIGGSAHA